MGRRSSLGRARASLSLSLARASPPLEAPNNTLNRFYFPYLRLVPITDDTFASQRLLCSGFRMSLNGGTTFCDSFGACLSSIMIDVIRGWWSLPDVIPVRSYWGEWCSRIPTNDR